ncbi:hypothetical protein [Prosthecobacter sp.]|uniref:hypothetical protein n=1 Tax=Prosthecobacter sp. TaxID=1965333 RepID=UPI003783AEA5
MSVYKNNAPEFQFRYQLIRMYEILRRDAYRMTSSAEDKCKSILELLAALLDRWADDEMKMLGESKNLEMEKEKVLATFKDLLQRRMATFERRSSTSDPIHCLTCGNELTLAYWGEEMVCEKCAHPIISALDQLVDASTNRYTAEQLFKIWQSWQK